MNNRRCRSPMFMEITPMAVIFDFKETETRFTSNKVEELANQCVKMPCTGKRPLYKTEVEMMND